MKKVISLILFFLASCSQHIPLEPKDWVTFIEDEANGFKRTIITKDFTYIIQYKPAELIALKESIKDRKHLLKRIEELENSVWFNISIKTNSSQVNPLKNNVTGMSMYNERLNFYLYNAEKYFSLRYNGIEVKKIGYFFENNFGLTPMDVMIIGFEIPETKPSKDIVLEFDDVYNGNRLVKVKITENDLLKLPTLKF